MATQSIAHLIDDLLSLSKSLGGIPQWRDMNAQDQFRLVVPVALDGKSTGLTICITARPNTEPLRFTITLNYNSCIFRIDWCEDDVHTNPFKIQPDISGVAIVGHHFHSWSDNKRFCTKNSLPKTLKVARKLSTEIDTFEGALAWMCQETKIQPPAPGLITLPPRTRLL